jgi:hypothetical protein
LAEPTENEKRADELFEKVTQYAENAAFLDTAAGYNVAINALKYVAAVLNPSKYGTKVVNSTTGATEGYILDTGIRREGDPGFQPGANNNEQAETTTVPDQNAELGGQVDAHDVGLD